MNRWECGHPDCTSTAVGVGGAVGLLAIGWEFKPRHGLAGELRCPAHRRMEDSARHEPHREGADPNCPVCAGETQANALQAMIQGQQRVHPVTALGFTVIHTWQSAPLGTLNRMTVELFEGGHPSQQYLICHPDTGWWMVIPPDALLHLFAALADTSDWLRYVMGPFHRLMRRELQNAIAGEPTIEGRAVFTGGRVAPYSGPAPRSHADAPSDYPDSDE